ncbi:cytochrome b/b6 domain-containing protein [Methylomonas sp. AM2-LC]|uniref:cytochrome b/b6 domain-containing protein n=1 Tax=Methylomonas sp. AM2-LC TaxID=3153301 RepID=UPI003267E2CA
MEQRRLVWDLPTRCFHWLLVLNFLLAYFSAESERWALVHITSGFSFFALLLFRLFWGVVGSRYVRFTAFLYKPATTLHYLKNLPNRQSKPTIGHNPLGAIAILLILSVGLICSISGWLIYADLGGAELEECHDVAATLMICLVLIHIMGVLFSSYWQRENLLRAMLDGKKIIAAEYAIPKSHTLIAVLLLLTVIGFWLWSFQDQLNLN